MTTVSLPAYHDEEDRNEGPDEEEEEEEDALLPLPVDGRRDSARQTATSRRRPQTPPWMYPIRVSVSFMMIFYGNLSLVSHFFLRAKLC